MADNKLIQKASVPSLSAILKPDGQVQVKNVFVEKSVSPPSTRTRSKTKKPKPKPLTPTQQASPQTPQANKEEFVFVMPSTLPKIKMCAWQRWRLYIYPRYTASQLQWERRNDNHQEQQIWHLCFVAPGGQLGAIQPCFLGSPLKQWSLIRWSSRQKFDNVRKSTVRQW